MSGNGSCSGRWYGVGRLNYSIQEKRLVDGILGLEYDAGCWIGRVVVEKLKLDVPPADLTEWKQVVSRIATRSKTCTIALVGKYVKLHDAYLSVMESLYHAGFENESKVEIKWPSAAA